MCQRTRKYTSTKKYVFDRFVPIFISTLLIATLSPHSTASAVQVTLGWGRPADGSAVNGYRVYSRVEGQSYNYTQPKWQGTATTCTIPDLQAVTTYFVARAYNSYGASGDSNEVVYRPASASAAISRNPTSLSPSCVRGSNASSQTFQVWNSGGGTLSYTISDNASWLSCSPTSGSSTGEQDTVTVTYATSGLATGTHTATITIAATGASNTPRTIPVTLTVKAAAPAISRNPTSLSPSCVKGSNASKQTFKVWNSGGGTLSYTISDNASWLSCSPTSGSSTGEQDTITVTYATSGLAVGTRTATITIAASGASNTPRTIPVTLTVKAAGSQISTNSTSLPVSLTLDAAAPAVSRNPTTLSPSCVRGTDAASQSFEVWNSGGGTLSYTISDDAGWLACNATSGTSTGAHNTVTVTYSTSTMTPGTYSATITIAATGATNSPQRIPVSLTVSDSQILPMEVGQVIVNQDWARVTFNRSFVDPVVVVGIATTNDPDPAVPRVRNLDRSGFDVRIQEWDYLDGVHGWDTVGYVVMERGDYVLPDGTRVEAGRFMTNKTNSFGSMRFAQPFQKVPIILASVTTVNEADAVTTRLRRIRTWAFDFRMQEQELNVQRHATETVCYIAWEPSSGTVEGLPFEVGRSNNVVPQTDQRVSFRQPFKTPPAFIAGIETTNGPDTASVRCRSLDVYQADVQIATEQSQSSGTNQTAEVVGYMVFGSP